MLSLRINDNDLLIKDVDKNQLIRINEWFSSSSIDQYKFAMGIDKPITMDDLYQKYLEVLINTHEFFLSLFKDNNFIGFVKGRVDYRDHGEIWIMSMLIDVSYQNRGIGRRVLNLLIDEFSEKFGITSFFACLVKDNVQAKIFWENNCFSEYRQSKGYFTIDNRSYDLIIMHKQV